MKKIITLMTTQHNNWKYWYLHLFLVIVSIGAFYACHSVDFVIGEYLSMFALILNVCGIVWSFIAPGYPSSPKD
jgi:protein-S-isoprenylcysteine O-methyltransferase Ste14